MGFRVSDNWDEIEARAIAELDRAARQVLTELNGRYAASFNKPAWNWPRPTERGGSYDKQGNRTKGVTVKSPRNIVDSRTLQDSQEFKFLSPRSAEYRWTTGYATAVHEGAQLRNGTVLPPRPWTDAVRGRVNRPGIPVYPMAERLRDIWLRAMRAG